MSPLKDQTVVVIGGSAGIGYETAKQARAAGAQVVLAARNSERLAKAAADLEALSSTAFDAADGDALDAFLTALPAPVDHVMVTAGRPYYAPLAELDFDRAMHEIKEHLFVALRVAKHAQTMVRPGGSIVLMSGTGARRPAIGLALPGTLTVGTPGLVQNLALEIAPVRINVVAPGFVDTGLSAELLGDQLDARREQLRSTLPIRRVIGPADVAFLAIHLMENDALTGAIYDVDGGQQLLR